VVAQRGDEHLRFMLEAAERLAMDNAVAVTLESGPYLAGLFVSQSAFGEPAFHRVWREAFLPFLTELANGKAPDHRDFNLTDRMLMNREL